MSIPHGRAIHLGLNRKRRKDIYGTIYIRADMLSPGIVLLEPGTGVLVVIFCQIPAQPLQQSAPVTCHPANQNGCPRVKPSGTVIPVFQAVQSSYPAVVMPLRSTDGRLYQLCVCYQASIPDSHKTSRIHLILDLGCSPRAPSLLLQPGAGPAHYTFSTQG